MRVDGSDDLRIIVDVTSVAGSGRLRDYRCYSGNG